MVASTSHDGDESEEQHRHVGVHSDVGLVPSGQTDGEQGRQGDRENRCEDRAGGETGGDGAGEQADALRRRQAERPEHLHLGSEEALLTDRCGGDPGAAGEGDDEAEREHGHGRHTDGVGLRVLGLDDVEAELPVGVGRSGGVREPVERVGLVDQADEVRDRAHADAIAVLVEERR